MSNNERKYTSQDLKIMSSWDLERKIATTQTRIMEFYDKFYDKTNNSSGVYVSFSGGKDSTVLLDITRRMYPDIPAVYVDTGLEYLELRNFVKTVDNVIWLRPEKSFKDVLFDYGYPVISKEMSKNIYYGRQAIANNNQRMIDHYIYGMRTNKKTGQQYQYMKMPSYVQNILKTDIPISNSCCDIMKKHPAKKFEKTSNLKPIVGTMAEESLQRKNHWLQHGCNAFDNKRPQSQPMSFWTEQDVLEYLVKTKIPYASVYGEIKQDENGKYYTTGCKRTGCTFCLFGINQDKDRIANLKDIEPKRYDYIMRGGAFDENGIWKPTKEGLGYKYVIDTLNENGMDIRY